MSYGGSRKGWSYVQPGKSASQKLKDSRKHGSSMQELYSRGRKQLHGIPLPSLLLLPINFILYTSSVFCNESGRALQVNCYVRNSAEQGTRMVEKVQLQAEVRLWQWRHLISISSRGKAPRWKDIKPIRKNMNLKDHNWATERTSPFQRAAEPALSPRADNCLAHRMPY